MKNYLKKIINLIFPKEKIAKEKIYKIIKYRNFLDRKNNIFSLLPYKNKLVRKAILELKFKNNTENADFFAEILLDELPSFISDLEIKENFYKPILITIPISF
jgi:predicted amidophosphoribosyltransferase